MSIYAMIDENTNIVSNTIVLDEGAHWEPPVGVYLVNIDGLEVGIDFSYDKSTKNWTAPVYPEPEKK